MIFQEFTKKFGPRFTDTNRLRWPTFELIAKELCSLDKPLGIVETGTARMPGNWNGDGQSTIMWDFLAEKTKGFAYSVDIDVAACDRVRKQVEIARVINADSIGFLRGFHRAHEIDFLYLDSYDWSIETESLSALHHIGELAAIWERLPKGCLIGMDDCHEEKHGKHVMVKKFFEWSGIECLKFGYVSLWRKTK